MAEQTSLFGIVVGIALLITGIGLIVLAYAVFVRTDSEAAASSLGVFLLPSQPGARRS